MKVYVLLSLNLSTMDGGVNGEYDSKAFSDYENAKKELQEWKKELYSLFGKENKFSIETDEDNFVYMTWDNGKEGVILDIRELEVN